MKKKKKVFMLECENCNKFVKPRRWKSPDEGVWTYDCPDCLQEIYEHAGYLPLESL